MDLHHQSPSLSQTAYLKIRRFIVTLALPPASVIDENQLQQALDLGRTPIREALKRLELENLVTIIPRRGMFVTDISILDLKRLYEVRLKLECLAVELAARRGKLSDWAEMADVLSRAEYSEKSENQGNQLIEIDEACHFIIYRAADNEFLENALKSWYTLSLRMWYFAMTKIGEKHHNIIEPKHIIDHQHILAALKNGDADLAVRLMDQHIRAYQVDIESIILGSQISITPTK